MNFVKIPFFLQELISFLVGITNVLSLGLGDLAFTAPKTFLREIVIDFSNKNEKTEII